MRRGGEAVGFMALTCLLLGITEPSVSNVDLFGPRWLQSVLFVTAALSCVTVLVWPDRTITRVGSGFFVSAAFAWRAMAAVVVDLFLGGRRPLYAVVLYVMFAGYISLTWHRVLPQPSPVRDRIKEWTGEP